MKTIKYITKKNFPVQVQYKTPIWNEETQSFTNDLEKEFLHEGIVFTPKKHIDNSFKLPNCSPIFHYKQKDWDECVDVFEDKKPIQPTITKSNEKISVWTEFEKTHLITYPDGSQEWVTESNYYMGNCLDWDLSEKWQTKEVKGKKFEMIPISLTYHEGGALDFIPKKNTKYKQYLIQFTQSQDLDDLNSKLKTYKKF